MGNTVHSHSSGNAALSGSLSVHLDDEGEPSSSAPGSPMNTSAAFSTLLDSLQSSALVLTPTSSAPFFRSVSVVFHPPAHGTFQLLRADVSQVKSEFKHNGKDEKDQGQEEHQIIYCSYCRRRILLQVHMCAACSHRGCSAKFHRECLEFLQHQRKDHSWGTVPDSDDWRVQRYSIDADDWSMHHTKRQISAMACVRLPDSSERIYLADAIHDEILIADDDFRLIERWTNSAESDYFHSVIRLLVTLDRLFILSTAEKNFRIRVFTLDGRFLFAFSDYQLGDLSRCELVDMALESGGGNGNDSDTFLKAIDRHNRAVHYFSLDGRCTASATNDFLQSDPRVLMSLSDKGKLITKISPLSGASSLWPVDVLQRNVCAEDLKTDYAYLATFRNTIAITHHSKAIANVAVPSNVLSLALNERELRILISNAVLSIPVALPLYPAPKANSSAITASTPSSSHRLHLPTDWQYFECLSFVPSALSAKIYVCASRWDNQHFRHYCLCRLSAGANDGSRAICRELQFLQVRREEWQQFENAAMSMVIASKEGRCFLTDLTSKRIRTLDLEGNEIQQTFRFPFDINEKRKHTFGLALDRFHSMLYALDNDRCSLYSFDFDGTCIKYVAFAQAPSSQLRLSLHPTSSAGSGAFVLEHSANRAPNIRLWWVKESGEEEDAKAEMKQQFNLEVKSPLQRSFWSSDGLMYCMFADGISCIMKEEKTVTYSSQDLLVDCCVSSDSCKLYVMTSNTIEVFFIAPDRPLPSLPHRSSKGDDCKDLSPLLNTRHIPHTVPTVGEDATDIKQGLANEGQQKGLPQQKRESGLEGEDLQHIAYLFAHLDIHNPAKPFICNSSSSAARLKSDLYDYLHSAILDGHEGFPVYFTGHGQLPQKVSACPKCRNKLKKEELKEFVCQLCWKVQHEKCLTCAVHSFIVCEKCFVAPAFATSAMAKFPALGTAAATFLKATPTAFSPQYSSSSSSSFSHSNVSAGDWLMGDSETFSLDDILRVSSRFLACHRGVLLLVVDACHSSFWCAQVENHPHIHDHMRVGRVVILSVTESHQFSSLFIHQHMSFSPSVCGSHFPQLLTAITSPALAYARKDMAPILAANFPLPPSVIQRFEKDKCSFARGFLSVSAAAAAAAAPHNTTEDTNDAARSAGVITGSTNGASSHETDNTHGEGQISGGRRNRKKSKDSTDQHEGRERMDY